MTINFMPPRKVEVPELYFKNKIKVGSKQTALIVVDMQNDFVEEDSSLAVPSAKETILNIKKLLDRARIKDVKIVYTQDTHI